ncbi:peptidase M23, partial [Vibrio sp. 10N.261.45.A7]
MTTMMKQIRAISRTLLISASLCVALLSTPSFAASQGELKGVSSEISRQQKNLSSQQKKLDSLQASLKKQELSIASLEKAILDSKKQLNTANANIANLD